MAEQPDGLLEVGRVGRAHGIRGDVFVDLSTDRVERAAVGARLWGGGRWLTIVTSAPSGKRWRVHFEGIDRRDHAEALTGTLLFAEPLVDADTIWVHDLIGARVVETSGIERGVCVAVVENPASDLIELDNGALVPVVFVTSLEADPAVVTIDPPDGLFDLAG